jgi:anti-anti-sigma factor
LDAHTANAFEVKLKEALNSTKKLVLDFKGVDYVGSAGLGALMSGMNIASGAGGSIHIANMSADVKKVFDTMGFSKVFKIFPTVDAAKGAF